MTADSAAVIAVPRNADGRIAEYHRVNMSSMPVLPGPPSDDLSIPEFLRREPHSPIQIDGDSR
jgi:hypothetical protein